MPVSCSMRRNGQPSRPNARTCCRFSSLKTLLMPTKATAPYVGINVPDSFPLAGFEVTLFGRFWVTHEVAFFNLTTLVTFEKLLAQVSVQLLAYILEQEV